MKFLTTIAGITLAVACHGAPPADAARRATTEVTNDAMSPIFQAVVEATEEAIYNSLFTAVTVTSRGRTIEALPLDRVRELLRKYNVSSR
jgi:D-aminopeptidase